MTKCLSILCASALLVSSLGASDAKHIARRLAGPGAVMGSAAGAGIGQARDSPHEWGQGLKGFAKRFGSSMAKRVVKVGIETGVAAWRHENLKYEKSDLQGTMPRIKYALIHTFIVPRKNRPDAKTLAISRISGNFGAGLISRAWQPASAAGIGAGFASGGIGLAAEAGVNVAKEFWPHHPKKGVADRTKNSPDAQKR